MNTQLQTKPMYDINTTGVFGVPDSFQCAREIAQMLMKSQMLPSQFKNEADCLIVLEMANRTKMPLYMVAQNIYLVHGKPAWASSFVISLVNASGYFAHGLRFEYSNNNTACVAWTTDRDGARLNGAKITIEMAHAEGWSTKSGSKWKTMPEQMLKYRAATFFARAYCPELLCGMRPEDEYDDIASHGTHRARKIVNLEPEENIAPQPIPEPKKINWDESDDIAQQMTALTDGIQGAKSNQELLELGKLIEANVQDKDDKQHFRSLYKKRLDELKKGE